MAVALSQIVTMLQKLTPQLAKAICSAGLVALSPAPAGAEQVTGQATVADGDSLSIHGIRIRLFGIDAPEGKQTCQRGGAAWACGEEAARQLRSLTASHEVRCEGRGTDAYGRLIAVCSVDGFELNKTMVEAGWATAFTKYSDDYTGVEARAKAARLGIWSSAFDLPENWRSASQLSPRASIGARGLRHTAAAPSTSTGCTIKGNRNPKGQWIYHLPGMPYYGVTRAEEMFCSEAQARAAGYRRAIVR
jgi:endonuclease YncB( thermonuclease family)